MTVVVDSSVVVVALADDGEHGGEARAALRQAEGVTAPHLVDAEVLSALRGLTLGGQLEVGRAASAVVDLADLDVERVPHLLLLDRAWSLRRNATAYDALYLALADALGEELLTFDPGMAATARSAGIACRLSAS